MLTPADDRRRWWGSFFLGGAASLLICGQTILKPYLEDVGYLLYWLACITFTWLAIFTAMLDFLAVRRQSRQERNELVQRALERINADRSTQTGPPPEPAKESRPSKTLSVRK